MTRDHTLTQQPSTLRRFVSVWQDFAVVAFGPKWRWLGNICAAVFATMIVGVALLTVLALVVWATADDLAAATAKCGDETSLVEQTPDSGSRLRDAVVICADGRRFPIDQ